ncbi:hypothetical protein HMPREF9140_02046 [Prevotella micans F0438]|uniref:Cleaved adhesin domain-containing protein n=1 Tax=Prevotella micans F0438 TaxID=883158 RepID=H1Q558_9BACT|nr:choice-of-anchor J domain-containing protein [Prevotella micans]EHO66036.1 hypothetical protein HMPREF9140_02046 [Prevotella micans F0438]
MNKNILIAILIPLLNLTANAQQRDKTLTIEVVANTHENLEGQEVTLTQTDYSLTYEPVLLNSAGQCSVKVYPGNHSIKIERPRFKTVEHNINIDHDKQITLLLNEAAQTPFGLTAAFNHNVYTGINSVILDWNKETPAFTDDFESYTPFAITFGNWTGIDEDHLATISLKGNYPNRGTMQYAQIMNPMAVEPSWWNDYPVLRPHSGKQYVGFVRTSSGAANNDWLISPTITPGKGNSLIFQAKAGDKYKEKFMVYATTKINNPMPNDFVRLDKGNYETVDHKTWQQFSYDLTEYEGQPIKFAIRYISEHNNGGAFMLMVDDIFVGQPFRPHQNNQAKRINNQSPENPNEYFEIYKNDALVGTTQAYKFEVENVTPGNYRFGVKAKYKVAESDTATVDIAIPAENYAQLKLKVTADSKLTADNQTITVASNATGQQYPVTVVGGEAEMKSLPKEKYFVSTEEGAFNAVSQLIDVQKDTTISITLTDRILEPYNITTDVMEGGKTTVKWNQILLFKDSFEEYADFSTGTFGNWITLDLDKKATYPISLSGSIINFPGASTPTNPAAVAPMVFNPNSTTPAMYPTDPAVKAPTGDKTVIFFSPQRYQANKWLISPELTIRQGYDLKVTAKSYNDAYPESIEFCLSTGSTDPADFTVIGQAENMPGTQWMQYSIPLASYVGEKVRLAVHYVSVDKFFAQIDDFTVGPANGETEIVDYGNVDHYDIYLDGVKIGEPTRPMFTIEHLSEGNHTIGLQSVYKSGRSPMVNHQIVVTSIESPTIKSSTVEEIYNLSGVKLNKSIDALPHGIYIVKQGSTIHKIRK